MTKPVPPANRRRHGRIRCEGLTCQLGQVVNLSAGGMRVHGAGWSPVKAGQGLWVHLVHAHAQVRVRFLVREVRRLRGFRYSIGGQFIGITPEISAQLVRLASMATPVLPPGPRRVLAWRK